MKNIYFYETELGKIGIADNGEAITGVFLEEDNVPKGFVENETPLIAKAARELEEYLAGTRKEFDLPLEAEGTVFQKAAWAALQTIPYGETRNYKQMAEQVGNPKACRAIGMANNRNPIGIIIPCHRVIGSDGSLVGYGGGLDAKERLLALERKCMDRD